MDNPDGHIDKKDFVRMFRKAYKQGNPEKYAEIVFKAFDSNKSGKITFDEFLLATAFVTGKNVNKAKGIEFAFDVYDINKNGSFM